MPGKPAATTPGVASRIQGLLKATAELNEVVFQLRGALGFPPPPETPSKKQAASLTEALLDVELQIHGDCIAIRECTQLLNS